jgi:hypothetical protein
MKRTLSLRSETLSSLTAEELTGVRGGQAVTTPVKYCLLDDSQVVCTVECYTRGTTCAC